MISMVAETLFTQTSAFFIGSNPPLSPQHLGEFPATPFSYVATIDAGGVGS